MSKCVDIHEVHAADALRRELKIDPRHWRQFRTALWKRFASDQQSLAELPAKLRDSFVRRTQIHPLTLHDQCDSQIDGATKLLFRTAQGLLLESVILRIASGRTTLCLSSQVGCAAACEFCATGKMGIAHNLTAAEILDQVQQAGQLLAREVRTIRNIVFMGMGEPLHNEENLYSALRRLAAGDGFHHSLSKVLVSTVGIPVAMLRCARRFPAVNLALSLHSVREEVRQRLIPLARRYTLAELQSTIRRLNALQQKPVMLEYLMLAGINDSAGDATELADWVAGLNVHVNLIPYNPIDDAPHLAGTDRAGRDAFAGNLKHRGVSTTIRYSLGADIAAACGQLVRREHRRLAEVEITPVFGG